MRVIIERSAGLDIHQDTVVACLMIGAPGARPRKEVRTFGTKTKDLEELRDWLTTAGVTHIGMESTGIYWRPIYGVLEGLFELIVGNARHIHNVPGRKTDVKDAEWIADLVRHGLIAKSFVPPKPLRDLPRETSDGVRTLSCSPFQAAGTDFPCLFTKQFNVAAPGQGRRHDHETTVDHALMRGLVTAGPVMRRGASSATKIGWSRSVVMRRRSWAPAIPDSRGARSGA